MDLSRYQRHHHRQVHTWAIGRAWLAHRLWSQPQDASPHPVGSEVVFGLISETFALLASTPGLNRVFFWLESREQPKLTRHETCQQRNNPLTQTKESGPMGCSFVSQLMWIPNWGWLSSPSLLTKKLSSRSRPHRRSSPGGRRWLCCRGTRQMPHRRNRPAKSRWQILPSPPW